MKNVVIVCLKSDTGVAPVAYSKNALSAKQLRRVKQHYKNTIDFQKVICLEWKRLYNSYDEIIKDLPEY